MFGVEGIVLHASSLLASHSSLHCVSRNVPSDRKRVQTASNKTTLFVYLFVWHSVIRPDFGSFKDHPEQHLFCDFVALQSHVRTHRHLQLRLKINIFLYLVLDCSTGESSRMDKRTRRSGEKCWSAQTGGTHHIFPSHHNQKQILNNQSEIT